MISMRSIDDLDRPARIPLTHVVWLVRSSRRTRVAGTPPNNIAQSPRRSVRATVARALRMLTSLRALSVLLPAVGGAMILGVIAVLMTQDRAMAIGLLVFSPVYVPLMTLLMISGRGLFGVGKSLAGDIASAMLRILRCPACGYDLSRSPAEPDGCRHCPECGSAWSDERCGERSRERTKVVVVEHFTNSRDN